MEGRGEMSCDLSRNDLKLRAGAGHVLHRLGLGLGMVFVPALCPHPAPMDPQTPLQSQACPWVILSLIYQGTPNPKPGLSFPSWWIFTRCRKPLRFAPKAPRKEEKTTKRGKAFLRKQSRKPGSCPAVTSLCVLSTAAGQAL